MANTITCNPLIIDTAATITFNRPLLCKEIDWVGAATVGNAAVITDLAGNIRAQGKAAVVNAVINLWSGPAKLTLKSPFIISTINSGQLMIWY